MKNKDEYIIVIGCGRLGSHLASLLSKARKNVVIIDKKASSFHRLSEDFSGITLEANALDEASLIEADIAKADVVVIATNDDNTNIMISQIAKVIYNVPKVIARLDDPSRLEVYQELDIKTICPSILSAIEFKNQIIPEEMEV